MEPWGRYIIGGFELVASILFFIPAVSWLGAFVALVIMTGAIFSHLSLLGIVVQDDSGLLFFMACAVFISSFIKLYVERYSIPVVGPMLKDSDLLAKTYDPRFETSIGQRMPIIIFFSFAAVCSLGITQQIFSIKQILGHNLPTATETRIAQWSYFMTLFYVFITFLLTLIIIRLFERPLVELINVCQKISKGDRSARSGLSIESELGILSISLNRMLDEIQKKESELNEKSMNIQRLLRVVVHDVANPLMVIQAVSDKVAKGAAELSETQKKSWARITAATNQIEEIIRSTRDFEAVRSGVKTLQVKSVPLLTCIESVIDTFLERAADKAIKFKVENNTGRENPMVLVEETIFTSSVISNIISNAIKFSGQNTVIDFVLTKADEKNLRLAIIDRGIGLPPEMLEKFKSGEQVQSGVGTSGEQGTGFGLDIARAIMRSMQGDLTIESKYQKNWPDQHGTSVSLIIPTV
jgi:signal transduction histidine kinase